MEKYFQVSDEADASLSREFVDHALPGDPHSFAKLLIPACFKKRGVWTLLLILLSIAVHPSVFAQQCFQQGGPDLGYQERTITIGVASGDTATLRYWIPSRILEQTEQCLSFQFDAGPFVQEVEIEFIEEDVFDDDEIESWVEGGFGNNFYSSDHYRFYRNFDPGNDAGDNCGDNVELEVRFRRRVSQWSPVNTRNFVIPVECEDRFEPNDSRLSATDIGTGSTINDVNVFSTSDYHRLSVPDVSLISATLDYDPEMFFSGEGFGDLMLYLPQRCINSG